MGLDLSINLQAKLYRQCSKKNSMTACDQNDCFLRYPTCLHIMHFIIVNYAPYFYIMQYYVKVSDLA